MSVFLAHIDVVDTGGTAQTLYVSDEPVRPFPSSDGDAPNRIYDPRLIEAANIRRDLFGDMSQGGGEAGYGVMKLSNADGLLSYLRDYAFKGIKIYRYQHGQDFNTAALVFRGVTARPSWSHTTRTAASLTLKVRNDMQLLSRNLQSTLYAGTAANGFEYEGEEGLAGRAKPITMGDLSTGHVPGVLVNPGLQVWQVNAPGISTYVSIDAVYDRGDNAGYSSGADLLSSAFDVATPGPTAYVTDNARGLVKLGGNPVGTVAFGVTQGASWNANPRTLIKRLLLHAGVDAADIGASFNSTAGPLCGIHTAEQMSVMDVIQFIARSEFAAVMPDHAGMWQYHPLRAPSNNADYELLYDYIIDLSPDDAADSPVGRVRVGHSKNHLPLSRQNMAPTVIGTARENYLENQWRFEMSENLSTQARYPNYKDIEILTPIRNAAAAKDLANTVLSILGPRPQGGVREKLRLVLPMDDERLLVPLGSVVHIDYPPANINGTYLLIGVEMTRPSIDQMIWRVWA